MKLIDKSAVVAEIEKLHGNPFYRMAIKDVLSILDTLEVKEVEEPSKDLEKAAEKAAFHQYIESESNYISENERKKFIEGAQWQKQQTMKDAIEREVKEDVGGYPYIDATELYDYDNDKPLAKAGDIVKVMFIKD